MRWYRLLLWISIFAVGFPALANADPVSTAIVTWVASAAFAASTAGAIVIGALDLAFSAGLSYVAKALAGKPKTSPLGVKGQIQAGGVVPRSFIVGYGSTAGLLCYANTFGNGKTPNAFLTEVIKLSDLPVSSLEQVWVYDQLVTYGSGTPDPDMGYAIPEYNNGDRDNLWVKFYDGTQTAADPFLVSTFGSDPSYPYDSNRKGIGIAYVIVTARIDEKLFSGFPKYNFACNGAKLYDPRSDSTNGGSGSQRFSDASTWAFTLNPMVVLYNVLRGVYYSGDWFYGLQSLTAKRLPTASWFAAANECDLSVDTNAGGTEAQYRCGGEIAVDVQPADAMDGLLMACNGRVAEIGGIYKAQAGASGSSVLSFTDSDLLTTDQQTFDQFPALTDLVNGITASYPEPTQEWASTDAPALYSADYEAADGDRRLISDVSYDLVPFAEQVQRLMKAALAEARRFRKHVIPFPPDGWSLEPLDVVSWTSTRNGYSAKAFRCDVVTDRDNLDLILAITEVDPADYDWNASTDYQAFSLGTLTIQRPAAQALTGWSLSGVAVDGDNGLQIPGLELQWDTDVDDVNGVQYQIRLTSSGAIALEGETDHWDAGIGIITQNLVRNTAYQGRARYRSLSSRDFDWTDWLDATTPDIRISALDIYDEAIGFPQFRQDVRDMQNFIGAGYRSLIDEMRLLADGVSQGLLGGASDTQTLRTELHAVAGDLTADYTNAISVAVGPLSSAVTSLDELSAAYGGDNLADIVLGLDARITDNEGDITSNASSITSLTSTVGNFSASGLFRVSTNASLNGASSTIAIAAAATSGGSPATAALYLSAMSDGTSQIIANADKFFITDGSHYDYPFAFTGSTLFVKKAVIPTITSDQLDVGIINDDTLIANNVIITGHLTANAVTKISDATGSTLGFGGGTVVGGWTIAMAAPNTAVDGFYKSYAMRSAGSVLAVSVEFGFDFNPGSTVTTGYYLQLFADTTLVGSATFLQTQSSSPTGGSVSRRFFYAPGDTASHTYKIKVGYTSSNTRAINLNGYSDAHMSFEEFQK